MPYLNEFIDSAEFKSVLRDYFAGLAMQGQMAEGGGKLDDLVECSYEIADAMLAAREVTQPDPVIDELVEAAREIVNEAAPHPHRINQAIVRKSSLGELDAALSRAKEPVK